MNNKIWMVGNSQLHLSVLSEYCSADDFQRFAEDWKSQRISEGQFDLEQRSFHFLFCNMTLLGHIAFDGQSIAHTRTMADFVKRIDSDASTIIVMLRGNEFAFESLVETPVPWDFTYGENVATKGRQVLKTKDVLAHLDRVNNAMLATCMLYRLNFPDAKVLYVAAPPPIESEFQIRTHSEGFGPLFERFGIRPFPIRKKIYSAMYDLLTQKLNRFGVRTLPAPAEALTESGGLRADYASGCLHGNNMYGRALMHLMEREGVYAPV